MKDSGTSNAQNSKHYTFNDVSGFSTPKTTDNPFQDLIAACHDDPAQILQRYEAHRINRNAQQKQKLLGPDFAGVTIDETLARLEDPTIEPGFTDDRNCLIFWARPPQCVRDLIVEVQKKLLKVAPNLWTMPVPSMHMTALEVAQSLTEPEIEDLATKISIEAATMIADYTFHHCATLVKPLLCFDAQALALTYLPVERDKYTYHHLRRDLFDKVQEAGVTPASRYVIPSAHLTIGRFIKRSDFEISEGVVDRTKVEAFVHAIDAINEWLQEEYWPKDNIVKAGGEWIVGQEKGLDYRKGTAWYGDGGRTVLVGKGF